VTAGKRREHAFIVRTWFEPSRGRESVWRGSVEHVASKQFRYFLDFADLCSFITKCHNDQADTASAHEPDVL
jgi:hypothetical protein